MGSATIYHEEIIEMVADPITPKFKKGSGFQATKGNLKITCGDGRTPTGRSNSRRSEDHPNYCVGPMHQHCEPS